ncbi:MAG: cytochrome c-type biogenesis protein CcmH [Alphaproteobacteria bacterium]
MSRHSPRMIVGLMVLVVTGLLAQGPARAVEPDEILEDPALEARARDISQELRCLVCRNESIDESNADLARDLRLFVRERLLAGDTDEGVVKAVRDRYGDYVLLKPPLNGVTATLWLAPLLVLLAGMGLAVFVFRRHGAVLADGDENSLDDEGDQSMSPR